MRYAWSRHAGKRATPVACSAKLSPVQRGYFSAGLLNSNPPCSIYFSFHCPSFFEGIPIHPTRVDSSLVFAIRQTGNRFANPILSNRHESFLLLSIRHAGSRFVRDLENIVDLYFEGGLKMLSIRSNRHESFLLLSIRHAGIRFAFSIISRTSTSAGLYRVVENGVDSSRFDLIDTNRFSRCRFDMLEVDLQAATPCESS